MSALSSIFKDIIPEEYKLNNNGGLWVIEEPRAKNNHFEVSAGSSFAFTLDIVGTPAFPHFSDAKKGMKSVNDGIIATTIGEDHYLVAIEMKSSEGSAGDALKQIESARLLLRWIRELLTLHGHWKSGQCKFIGIISLTPRKSPAKGTSRRCAELPTPKHSKYGYPYFILENHPRISIQDLVTKITTSKKECPPTV
ncbi:hypothetical protein G7047_13400 [Diaphorobacter sp. HDW4A]|uniref:hypothetical protein n=1 Tax=Diaphorobacter sp. HDW4A TaxID=2714924 RepID=UPI001409D87F|nr:hypothetical protein [Diaphorobacter sp. HDW4A]QIL78494.1 hypothetical protein G7047_00085 [Diaphorobacter sp. HDW4A]QIL80790.1 hypothetical protein G7047_13400 [Diaphorobacter sp. HDW4A]